MKTAISIPDRIFKQAERAARRLGLSRSEFFTLAAQRMTRRVESKEVTARIDRALAAADGAGALDSGLAKMQSAALADEQW